MRDVKRAGWLNAGKVKNGNRDAGTSAVLPRGFGPMGATSKLCRI